MATVSGIDVSHWQSAIDWTKVRGSGNRFTMIKASEGTTFRDPSFRTNWSEAKTQGLLRGAYCYFHPNLDPRTQADLFIREVKSTNDPAELPHALDLEVANGVLASRIISNAKIWLERVEQEFRRKPFIYSGISFLETYLSEVGGGPPTWAKNFPLWLGWYPNEYVPGMKPRLPRGWFKWTVWQYSKNGIVNGINAEVDLDVFNGTLRDLYKFAGVQLPVQPPRSHIVQAGDTFDSITSKFGVTLNELTRANSQLLRPGDRLVIPGEESIPDAIEGVPEAPPPVKYIVKAGDTLTDIARRFGTTVAAIVSLNNIPNPDLIHPGQELIMP